MLQLIYIFDFQLTIVFAKFQLHFVYLLSYFSLLSLSVFPCLSASFTVNKDVYINLTEPFILRLHLISHLFAMSVWKLQNSRNSSFSELSGPNWTEFNPRRITSFFRFRCVAAILDGGDVNATGFENLVKIVCSLTPVIFRGGSGQMSEGEGVRRSATSDITCLKVRKRKKRNIAQQQNKRPSSTAGQSNKCPRFQKRSNALLHRLFLFEHWKDDRIKGVVGPVAMSRRRWQLYHSRCYSVAHCTWR